MPLAALTPTEQLRAGRMPRRVIQLFVGLTLYGISMAFFAHSGLGMLPWDVFHFGITRHIPLSFGTVVVVVSLLTLLLWIPLRQYPGLGTLANALWIGVVLDATLAVLPSPGHLPGEVALLLAGLLVNGIATALYIGAQLGPGPRDGLMTGLAARTGGSLRVVRTGIEVVVVAFGWLLGGVFGVGTVLYALAIGPLVQWLLPPCIVELPKAAELLAARPTAPRGPEPEGPAGA